MGVGICRKGPSSNKTQSIGIMISLVICCKFSFLKDAINENVLKIDLNSPSEIIASRCVEE